MAIQKQLKGDADLIQRLFSLIKEIKDLEDLRNKIGKAVVSETIENLLLAGALKFKSSEISLEAQKDKINVRFKKGSELYEAATFDKKYYPSLISRFKLKAGLKTNIKDEPQNGKFGLRINSTGLEFEISTLPTEYGENILLRLLTSQEEIDKLETELEERSQEKKAKEEFAKKPEFLKKQLEKEKELGEKLTELKKRETEDKAKDLAKSLDLPYIDLTKVPIKKEDVFILDEETARGNNIAIIKKIGLDLTIAALNPQDEQTKKVIDKLKDEGFEIKKVYVISVKSFNKIWEIYKEKKVDDKSEKGIIKIDKKISDLQEEIKSLSTLKEKLLTISITELLEILLAGALKTEASDIHIEPEEDKLRIRYRLDGVLQDISYLNKKLQPKIISRIKIKSGLKINITNAPQDGRFTIRQKDVDIEVRISTLPGAYGETVVMRLLDPRTIKQGLGDLGMRDDLLLLVKKQLKKTNGAIITTGPTGSGKTTALYAFLKEVNKPGIKIITIEDPIEYHIEGISQSQVNPKKGYTFANGLRSIVRQDPDVILVGEIRDRETAEIAVQAALTGHLVFTTLHTNDAAGAIPRLLEFNLKPHIISPAINIIMAQRLIRKLCQDCKYKVKITSEELNLIKQVLSTLPEKIKPQKLDNNLELWKAKKCGKCGDTGYKGRIGVFEAFLIDAEMEKIILKYSAMSEIKEMAVKKGMITIYQDAYLKVLKGITDIEEVRKVLGIEGGKSY